MPLPKLFSKEKIPKEKHSKHDTFLLEEYEKNRILQIDNDKDNKEHFNHKEKKK